MMIPHEVMDMQLAESKARLAAKDARIAELEKALRLVVTEGIGAFKSDDKWVFHNGGCGCCSGLEELEPEMDKVVRSVL